VSHDAVEYESPAVQPKSRAPAARRQINVGRRRMVRRFLLLLRVNGILADRKRLCKPLQAGYGEGAVLDPDRLLPPDPGVRRLARGLYERTKDLPIVSPHGHVDPASLAADEPISDPAVELVTRDHYLLRMLYSQGVPLESLRGPDGRATWRTFADHYHLFRATPSKLWLDHTLAEVFGVTEPLTGKNADATYDHLVVRLADDDFRPRALLDRFGIELLATTDSPLSNHEFHGWSARVVPTFRPDDVVDPDRSDFATNLDVLAKLTGEDTTTWDGYLAALRARRAAFIALGATASDHGHPTAATLDLPAEEAEALFHRVREGVAEPEDAEAFRAQILVEMAAMSMDDGLVLQLHCGSWRNHNPTLAERFGRDVGADIPKPMDYVGALKPLLDRFGNEPSLTVVVYTLDEDTYSRELAPLAGHYPALRLGPPWWFHDSPEGMRRFRQLVTETAGFANTVGFNDDARSLLTIPARHDVCRRIDAGFLAGLVAEGRLRDDEAAEVADDLAVGLARRAFRVEPT
jgi:glucuronate isomerase